MSKREELDSPKLSRRESLKLSGLALGGLALGRRLDGQYPLLVGGDCPTGTCYPTAYDTQRYSYFESLETMDYRQLPVLPGMPRNPSSEGPVATSRIRLQKIKPAKTERKRQRRPSRLRWRARISAPETARTVAAPFIARAA